jgi:hypothetical protein
MTSMTHLRLALIFTLFGVGCSGGDGGDATGGGGGGAASTAGTTQVNPGGGSNPTTTGGSGGQYVTMVTLAGSGQAIGDGDQGMLFGPDGAVPIMPPETTGGSGGSGGSGIPGDGNMFTSMIRGSINGTAVFTQKGEDVTVVVNLNSGCADGNHQFRIHDGYSCDSASTEGMPWTRGTGIGPANGIACTGGKGMLMYTRSGADKTKNWTVGDHVQETDLTAHVVIVSDEKDANSRASCGNFF